MTVWTDEMIECIRTMAGQGSSAAAIAASLTSMTRSTITRNAVIGKAARCGVTLGRKGSNDTPGWDGAPGEFVKEKGEAGWTPRAISDGLKAEFGLDFSPDAVRRFGRRNGIVFAKAERSAPARVPAPLPKRVTAPAAAKPPARKTKAVRLAAPALFPVDPPFLPPLPLVREYVPTGRMPVTFLASGDFVCKAFLPGEPLTHAGLVCGNPVPEGRAHRFCAACSETLIVSVKAPARSTFVTLGKRRAAA